MSTSDPDLGPALPTAAPRKRRKLPYEKLYLDALPASPRYSRSLMHRDQVTFVHVTAHTDFCITGSLDGVVKFWKKTATGIEAVKEFRAHRGDIRASTVSHDGRNFASAGVDRTVKLFDVVNFDLLAILELDRAPRTISWIHPLGASLPLLAVSYEVDGHIDIFDGRGERKDPLHSLTSLHKASVVAMAHSNAYDCVVSADTAGMVEYWRAGGSYEKPENVFGLKSSTDLFAFKKSKSVPTSITVSPSGARFATISFPDRKIRVFEFATAKLLRTYDESLATIEEMQQAGTALHKLEEVELGRRLAVERSVENAARINVAFDESSNFVLYGSLHGIKVINVLTNRVVKVYGEHEAFRALHLGLYQGAPQRKTVTTVEMAASTNPLLEEAEAADPILFATGLGKPRFYMFTNETNVSKTTRDVQNERPREGDMTAKSQSRSTKTQLGHTATIHTTYGDIGLRLFPALAPKTVENFTVHSRQGYYNNTLFHRVIKKFMIQGGDPKGDGTGGTSIWGKEFEDEISPSLKHDQAFTLSMANAGPNTNGSQFFITTEPCPWLDGKHTVFGRAVAGLDVVKRIESVRTRRERPEDEIHIMSIEVV